MQRQMAGRVEHNDTHGCYTDGGLPHKPQLRLGGGQNITHQTVARTNTSNGDDDKSKSRVTAEEVSLYRTISYTSLMRPQEKSYPSRGRPGEGLPHTLGAMRQTRNKLPPTEIRSRTLFEEVYDVQVDA